MALSWFRDVGRTMLGGANLAGDTIGQQYAAPTLPYDTKAAFYANSLTTADEWKPATGGAGLNRNLRAVLNPVLRTVEWWAHHVYSGVWTSDGLPSSDGKRSLVPFVLETPEEIRLAAIAGLGWGNWMRQSRVYARTGAALDEVFGEVIWTLPSVDEFGLPTSGKVFVVLHNPKYVKDVTWDYAGNVTSYRLEIPRYDPKSKTSYRWGKVVTKATITTLYNDVVHSYEDGVPGEQDNPWGFVAADWVMHRDIGEQHGAGALYSIYPKIAEVNGLVTAVDDYILRFIEQFHIIETDDPAGFTEMVQTMLKGGPTRERADPNARRESIRMFAAKAPASTHPLLQNMGLGEADPHIQRLVEEIEKDLPEITLSEKLALTDNITSPGARALMAPVQAKLDESGPNYDTGLIKFIQAMLTIGGELANTLAWGPRSQLTAAQQLFLPFRLDSYSKGEIPINFMGRTVLDPSMQDRIAEAAGLEALITPFGLRHAGIDEAEIFGEIPEGQAFPRPGLLAELTQARQAETDRTTAALSSGLGL